MHHQAQLSQKGAQRAKPPTGQPQQPLPSSLKSVAPRRRGHRLGNAYPQEFVTPRQGRWTAPGPRLLRRWVPRRVLKRHGDDKERLEPLSELHL